MNYCPRCCFLIIGFLVLSLICSCSGDSSAPAQMHLTPIPQDVIDPNDFVLRQSVGKILKDTGSAPLNSGYISKRIDLNNDGRRDALVLFKTPYGFWCGTHGCTMFIMKAHNDHFTLVNDVQTIRPPIYISQQKTNGWKNIILRVSGRRNKAKNVAMQFDGTSYPKYPDTIPAISTEEYNGRAKLFN